MSVKKKRTIGPCRGVTWLYRCRHGISSLLLAFVPSFSSRSFPHYDVESHANTKIRNLVESLFKFCEESLRVQLERKQQEVEVVERRCQHGKTEEYSLTCDDLNPHLFSATHDLCFYP